MLDDLAVLAYDVDPALVVLRYLIPHPSEGGAGFLPPLDLPGGDGDATPIEAEQQGEGCEHEGERRYHAAEPPPLSRQVIGVGVSHVVVVHRSLLVVTCNCRVRHVSNAAPVLRAQASPACPPRATPLRTPRDHGVSHQDMTRRAVYAGVDGVPTVLSDRHSALSLPVATARRLTRGQSRPRMPGRSCRPCRRPQRGGTREKLVTAALTLNA